MIFATSVNFARIGSQTNLCVDLLIFLLIPNTAAEEVFSSVTHSQIVRKDSFLL